MNYHGQKIIGVRVTLVNHLGQDVKKDLPMNISNKGEVVINESTIEKCEREIIVRNIESMKKQIAGFESQLSYIDQKNK